MMKTFTSIIIDDERPARLMIKQLLGKHAHAIGLIGEADSGGSAIELIEKLKPDLIFLDIQMHDMDGFSMLVRLKHKPMVIFTTAYEQYALKAFQENALDYLVKPIDEHMFLKSVEKIVRWNNAQPQVDFSRLRDMFEGLQPKKEISALPIKIKDGFLLVRLNTDVYLEAGQGYVTLHTDDGGTHLSELSLSQLEEKLPSNFMRVQKSYIVNKDKIHAVTKHFNNRMVLTMDDRQGSRIMTGTTYIEHIRAFLDH
jgi:two-component system LytT family response regulator